MTSNLESAHRTSLRLRNYNYAQAGLYFVTVCCYERRTLFGRVVDGAMNLSVAGKIAREEWLRTSRLRSNVFLDEFVIMPNHMHGIINLADHDIGSVTGRVQRAATIGDVVRGYKSAVTRQIKELHCGKDVRVWQRNYYEHIIRDDAAHSKICEYIQGNPQRWLEDTYYANDSI